MPSSRQPRPSRRKSAPPAYLERQVELIQPRVIATLGNSTKLLTANPTGITKVRGTPQDQMIGGRHLYLPPFPSGRRTAHAGWPSSCARTSARSGPAAAAAPEPGLFRRVSGRLSGPDGPVRRLITHSRGLRPWASAGGRGSARRRGSRRRRARVRKDRPDPGAAGGVTEPVTSPTFTIGHLPRARPGLHLDLYRLADLGQEDQPCWRTA
jgi:hypothetical protein